MPKSADEIADMIDTLKGYYVAATMGLLVLNHPKLSELLLELGFDPGSTTSLGRKDGTKYAGLDVYEALGATRGSAGFNLDYMGALLTVFVSWVGDALAENLYFDETPELELFRHIRNGLSHGNRFELHPGQPKKPAQFGSFKITRSLHGENVLFEFMGPGDVFDLLDHVNGHLRGSTTAVAGEAHG